jgi:hypothetical protein
MTGELKRSAGDGGSVFCVFFESRFLEISKNARVLPDGFRDRAQKAKTDDSVLKKLV